MVNAARGAAHNYYDRYRALPGDDPNGPTQVDPRLVAGNGDGIVGPTPGPQSAPAITAFGTGNLGENYQYFKALVAAGLLNNAQVGLVSTVEATNFGEGSSLPSAPITGAGMTVVYGVHDGDASTLTTKTGGHWYRIHKNPVVPVPAFTPRQLANIDSEIDDGSPEEGGVRADGSPLCAPQTVGGKYVVSDQTVCVGIFYAHP
jgi:hypothetical protein